MGPFRIKDNLKNLIADNVSRETLKKGVTYAVVDEATVIVITSLGKTALTKYFPISAFNTYEYADATFIDDGVSCVWKHLKNPLIYNTYYGNTEPYIIEYPFAYDYQDEIVQNIQDHTQVYKYVPMENDVLGDYSKFELDDVYFNKAILYNNQQCSGVLNLVPKPEHNLKSYMTYPILNSDSKDILFTKSDNFYQYNTFWSITKDTTKTHFVHNCESLNIDKVINQDNMDYSGRNFNKAPLRAKELKVRHILDNRDDVKLVSQFLLAPAQISYK